MVNIIKNAQINNVNISDFTTIHNVNIMIISYLQGGKIPDQEEDEKMNKKQAIEYAERFGECQLAGVTFDTFKEVNSWMNFLRKKGIDNVWTFERRETGWFLIRIH